MKTNKKEILLVKKLLKLKTFGTVKWYNDAKGIGVITCRSQGKEVYFSHKYIIMDGFKTLNNGDNVELEIDSLENGKLIGLNVKLIKNS